MLLLLVFLPLSGLAQDSLATDTGATDSAALAAKIAAIQGPSVPVVEAVVEDTARWDFLIGSGKYFTMMVFIALLVLLVLLFLFEFLFYRFLHFESAKLSPALPAPTERLYKTLRAFRKWGTLLIVLGGGIFFFWTAIRGTPLEGHVLEWMNLIVRWGHVVFAMAWIGASFYFVFLENSLNRTDNIRDELAGNLWAIHGGGFYYVEKYKIAPPKLPKHLHWFKWEAYITWISGFTLLIIVYYFNAKAMLVDPEVMDLAPGTAIAIGIGTLLVSWLVYDLLCKTPLVEQRRIFFFVMFAFIALLAFLLSQVFSSRAAYIHVGGVIGTLMAGNVFRIIIPSQRALVTAAENNEPLDPSLGKHAGLRSLHNNYFTLPVIFIMISNHFPSTYGNAAGWFILAGLTLASAGIKHYFNLKDQGRANYWLIPVSSAAIIALAFIASPRSAPKPEGANAGPVPFYEAYRIVTLRCQPCHAKYPTDTENATAPNGAMFDTPAQIVARKDEIYARSVVARTMPQGNKTNMTEEERATLGRWIEQGAKVGWEE